MAAISAMRPATIDVIAPPGSVAFEQKPRIARDASAVDPRSDGFVRHASLDGVAGLITVPVGDHTVRNAGLEAYHW